MSTERSAASSSSPCPDDLWTEADLTFPESETSSKSTTSPSRRLRTRAGGYGGVQLPSHWCRALTCAAEESGQASTRPSLPP